MVEVRKCGKRVVVLTLNSTESMMAVHDFAPYVEKNALRLATTNEEFATIVHELNEHPEARAELASQGAAFLQREFAFDGHAGERTAELIRSLVRKRSDTIPA